MNKFALHTSKYSSPQQDSKDYSNNIFIIITYPKFN